MCLKIKWQLRQEGIVIHERTIGKILKKKVLINSSYNKRKNGLVPYVVEMFAVIMAYVLVAK
jgi:hypothetical protein